MSEKSKIETKKRIEEIEVLEEDETEEQRSKKRKVNKDDDDYIPSDNSSSQSSDEPLIDPTYDISFKKICSDKKIVISILNNFLSLKNKIIDITFISQEDQPELIGLKSIRFDIICKDETDNTFIVEIQRAKEPSFVERTLFYWAKVYSSELKISQKYTQLKPVIILAFLNFNIFPEKKNYIHHCVLKTDPENEIVTEHMKITYVEFSKFKEHKIESITDQWMYFFTEYKEKGELQRICFR